MAPLGRPRTLRKPARASRLALALRIVALALGFAAPGITAAELYRCTLPDGRTVFTDSRGTCPGADAYEPRGEVHRISREEDSHPAAPSPPARSKPQPSVEMRQAEKANWQRHKQAKQQELTQLEERAAYLKQYVTACNRGAEIFGRDETGIKHRVPCDQIRQEYAENAAQQQPLREYLESGLARECRKAGCLPGWIR